MAVARQGDLGTATIRVIANTTEFDFRLRRSLKNLSVAAAGVGAALAGVNFLGSTVKEAAKLETVMARIRTIMDSPADEAFLNTDKIREISNELGVAATEVAEASYLALSSGTNVKDVIDVITASGKTAISTNSTLTESVNATTSALNAFGKSGLTAENANDILFRSLQFGKGTMREFARYISNAIPIVSQLTDGSKDAFAQLSAMGAASTLTGKTARVSFTGLKVAMQELSDASQGGGKVFQQIFGESFQDYVARTDDLAGALIKFGKKAGGKNLTNIFGAKEGAAAIQQLLAIPEARLNEIIQETRNSAGIVEKAWGKVSRTYEREAQRLKQNWTNLKSELGESLLPVATQVVQQVQNILDKTRPMFKEMGEFFDNLFTSEDVAADFQAIKDHWNTTIKPIFDDIVNAAEGAWPQWRQAIADVKDAFVALGEALAPVVTPLAEVATQMGYVGAWTTANFLSGIAEVVKELADNLWILAAALAVVGAAAGASAIATTVAGARTLKEAMLLLSWAVKYKVIASLTALKTSLLATRAAMLLTSIQASAMWIAITGPVGIVIVAIGAVVLAGIYLYKKFEIVRRFWQDVWLGMKAAAFTAINAIVGVFGGLVWVILQMARGLIKGLGKIPFFGGAFSGVEDAVNDAIGHVERLSNATKNLAQDARDAAAAYNMFNKEAAKAAGAPQIGPKSLSQLGLMDKDLSPGVQGMLAAGHGIWDKQASLDSYKALGNTTSVLTPEAGGVGDTGGLNEAAQDAAEEAAKEAAKAMKAAFNKIKPALNAIRKGIAKASVETINEEFKTLLEHMKAGGVSKKIMDYVKKQQKALVKEAKARDKVSEKLDKETDKLNALKDARKGYMDSIKASFRDLADVTTTGYHTIDGLVWRMERVLEVQRKFRDSILALSKTNIDKDVLRDIVEAGAVEGANAAEALLAGGQAGIDTINTLYREQESLGKEVGVIAGNDFYNAGIKAAEGLVKGLQSQKDALIKEMESLADALVNTVKKKLKIQSPSKVFEDQVGAQIVAGMTKGITSNMGAIEAATGMASSAVAGAGGNGPMTVNIVASGPTLQDIVRVEIRDSNRAMKNRAMAGSTSGTLRK